MNRAALHFLLTTAAALIAWGAAYGLVFIYQLGAPVPADYNVADTKAIQHHIASTTRGRKVLLVGGSSTLLGFDGELMHSITGIETVNLGCVVWFDLTYMLRRASQYARPGDIVILAAETFLYLRDNPYNEWSINNIMAWDGEYFWSLPALEKIQFVLSAPLGRIAQGVLAQYQRDKLVKIVGQPTDRRKLIARAEQYWKTRVQPRHARGKTIGVESRGGGICVARRPFSGDGTDFGLKADFTISQQARSTIERFSTSFKDNEIELFLAWPITSGNNFDVDSAGAHAFSAAIRALADELDLVVLGDLDEYYFDNEHICNTAHHLNAEGRKLRTMRVATSLRHQLQQNR